MTTTLRHPITADETPAPSTVRRRCTERLVDVLCAIASSIRARGFPPTQREIGSLIGLASTNVVAYHLVRLAELGLITRGRSPRSIVITPAGEAVLGIEQPLDTFRAEGVIERLEMGA